MDARIDCEAERKGVALRTTMIVGHPGEGEEEFEELLAFIREARFERMGAFTYSEEEGTYGAAHLEDDVPQDEKQRRYDLLMNEQREISLACNQSRVGAELKVMVDEIVGDPLVCRSEYESPEVDGEIIVKGGAGNVQVGDFIKVRILSAEFYDLLAERII